jgi:SH3-like domain-containing protein
LCGFYDEFGKNLWQAFARPRTIQAIPSSQKLLKEGKEPSPPPAETPKTSPLPVSRGKVIWAYVNLREGPGTRYRIIGKAYLRNTFEILAEKPGWLRVRLESGGEGWMSKRAASESPTIAPPQSPPASSHDSSKARSSSKPPGPM